MSKIVSFVVSLVVGLACSDDRGFELGHVGALVVSPTALEIVIDETPRGGESTHELRLSNTGSGPVTVRALTLAARDGEAPPVRLAPTALPFEIAPGAAPRVLGLVYTRSDDEPRELELTIESNDPLTPSVRVPIHVIEGQAHLVVHPTPVVFEQTEVPLSETVRLLNTGNAALSVSRLTLVAPADFAVSIDERRMAGGAPAELVLSPPVVIEPGGRSHARRGLRPARHDARRRRAAHLRRRA